ncbi:MAG: stage II sporulation protein D [Oscillospiraceae bacterium]|nr:stage II sporulation protein D [Oscillospiraceae bacterium]
MEKIRSVLAAAFVSVLPILLMALIAARPGAAGQSAAEASAPELIRRAGLWLEKGGEESADLAAEVLLITADGVEKKDMRSYLVGAVAAEMPASFMPEALEAQAVAARTFTYYRMTCGQIHENGAVCGDPGCCKAYMDTERLKERWGDKWRENLRKVERAVERTDGEILVYDGQPVFAAFHSSSCGSTEDSENVWSGALPYLRAVESPEKAENVPGYYSEVTLSFDEFRRAAESGYPQAELSCEPDGWLAGAEYSTTGRLKSVSLGGVRLSGTQLRRLFGLRSTAVIWELEEDGVHFHVSGYGHGVGMSQYGAEAMAREGEDHEAILAHYYTGTQLEKLGADAARELSGRERTSENGP